MNLQKKNIITTTVIQDFCIKGNYISLNFNFTLLIQNLRLLFPQISTVITRIFSKNNSVVFGGINEVFIITK